ncbi:PilZ domain-containing protein [Bradyrhizobium erythrophlei]|uniref:PilZ domain-containing protein n=1 Tax=Bradyrhizobium erythrophlei TaxID=1437360 RepID=UPI0035E4AD3A
MRPEKRRASRVKFTRGVEVDIAASDGTWKRRCLMLDASESGVKLRALEPIAGLDVRKFLLLLSTTGSVFRRCELTWVMDDQIGARFENTKQSTRRRLIV